MTTATEDLRHLEAAAVTARVRLIQHLRLAAIAAEPLTLAAIARLAKAEELVARTCAAYLTGQGLEPGRDDAAIRDIVQALAGDALLIADVTWRAAA